MLKDTDEGILEKLHQFNKKATGICFALAMRNEDDKIEIYKRVNQPCYGELRKYQETHGKECTRPESGRPGDLRHPFPAGIPEALAIGLPNWRGKIQQNQEMFDFLLGKDSPFIKGFIGPENIEWSEDQAGFVLLDTSFDPTVLVNLLKHLQYIMMTGSFMRQDGRVRFTQYIQDDGLSLIEAFVFDYCVDYCVDHPYNHLAIRVPDMYVYPTYADLERIITQNPVDLTEGTLRDRFDYNRKRMHEIFYKKDGVNFTNELGKRLGINVSSYRKQKLPERAEVIKTFKEIFNEQMLKLEERKAA